jgi:8-oxo-dGTP pyrophosphatase MutT (NUDIX family)
MSAGETPLEAAVREAKEEVGLVLDSESLKLVEKCIQNNKQTPNRIHNAYEWNHIAKSNLSGSNVKLQKSEATDAKWMLLDEFERALNDKGASKNYAPRDKKLYTLIIKAIRGVLNND